jgi:hypothetical protein
MVVVQNLIIYMILAYLFFKPIGFYCNTGEPCTLLVPIIIIWGSGIGLFSEAGTT